MQRKAISWILDFTDKLPSDEERIKCLQVNGGPAMRIILKYALDPRIVFLLPKERPPFEKNGIDGNEEFLYREASKLYHFIEGGNPNLHQIRRETLFVQILESVSEEDAELLIHVKNKTLPYKNITLELAKMAFPEDYV